MLIDWGALLVYNYGGRLISSVRNPVVQTAFVYPGCIALSGETIAAKDSDDEKGVKLNAFVIFWPFKISTLFS